jgi:hypothetical protein
MLSPYRQQLPADYVQVAHHGWTNGIDDLYRQIGPTYALWPTTPEEVNGTDRLPPAATASVQSLLQLFNVIGVKENYFSYKELYRID